MRRGLLNYVAVFLLIYTFYIVFTGSTALFSLVLGLVASAILTPIITPFLTTRSVGLRDLKRLGLLILYYFRYMLIDEVKAHLQVIRIVLSRDINKAIRPAIVKVPFSVETDYGITLTAGSITNTPGTCVIDVDKERKVFYVHWIYATTTEPEKAREEISKVFEEYAKRIFE